MFGGIGDIFKKTIRSKAFWMGLLLCLTFSIAIPSPVAAEYDCPGTDVLKERYMGDCFPCQIVNVLLASFMRAAGKVYDVSKEAGNKLLFIGAVLWLAFWALKKMSSMANVEPASMSNELVVFFGKVVVAYCFINAGIGTLVNYAVNPILGAGADWGTALLLESKNMEINSAPKQENTYKGPTEIVDKSTMDKILKLSEGVSNEVAMNLVIGNALTCYSIKKGIHFKLPGIIEIHIPDIWLWLVGAAIWCAGFMLVLSVCYYLIDIPFKIGFAIIALPVVIGLWPFKITAGKLKDVVMVAFNAAGTFLFLALSSSYAMRLISQSFSTVGSIPGEDNNSLSGADALLTVMNGELDKDNMQYVENVFSITGGSFLIIMFCYIYGIKMISQVTQKFPDKFFKSSIASSAGSPLHHMATAATMWASKKAAAPFKMAGDIVAHQAGKAATTAAKAAGNVGLGIAGAAAGSVTRSIGRRAQNFGQRMAEKAKKNKEGWDSLDRYDSLNQSGMRATIGNKLGKLGARAQVGLANTIARTGEHLDTAGQYMAAPGERTFNRVRNAWEQGTKEVSDAAREFGEQLPGKAAVLQSAGQTLSQLSQAGKDLIDDASSALDKRMKKKPIYHPGKILHKVSAPILKAASKTILETTNKTGMMIEKVGDGAAHRPKPSNVKRQARKEFAEATAKLGESGKKLATYVPKSIGETVRGLGFYYTAKAEYSDNRATAFLSSRLGAVLTRTGSGIVDNRPDEKSLRHKGAKLLEKSTWKTVFSGKTIKSGLKKGGKKAFDSLKSYGKGIASDFKADWADTKDSALNLADNVAHMGRHIKSDASVAWDNIKDSGHGIATGYKNFGKDVSGAYGELKKSTTDLGRTLAHEHHLNTGARYYDQKDLDQILSQHERLLNDKNNGDAFEDLHKRGIADLKDFAEGKLNISTDSQTKMDSFIKTFGTNSKGELTPEGQAAYNRLIGLTSSPNGLNRAATVASAVVGTSGALQFGSGLGTMGIGAVAGRHLYNNTREAVEETMAAWKDGKIDNLFDLAGAVAHPFVAVPHILTNTASQTIESTYQVAEKTMLAGIDVALTVASPFKSTGKAIAHTANILENAALGAAMIPTRAVVIPVLNAGEIGIKSVRMVTRATANAVLPLAFAPVGFAAKAVDETLYAAYKMTVRPAAAVGTAAVRGAKVLYKGVELGVKSTKVGRGTIRTFKAGGKTLKVGVKTLKLGRDMIRAAAGEGGYSNDPKTREEKEQLRKERKMRRQAELEKERKKQEAREREEQEAERRSEEFRNRHEQEEAQRRAEEEAARQAAQVEAERRDAAEAASIQTEDDAAPDQHQTLTDAINNEEIESTKNYSKDDLQKILDTHEQLLNGTGNGTAFESLHENSVADLQKFAEGKVTIDKDSYATMVPFIKTFGTDDKGQLTDIGRAAQTKLTSLMTGGSSGGTPSGGNK